MVKIDELVTKVTLKGKDGKTFEFTTELVDENEIKLNVESMINQFNWAEENYEIVNIERNQPQN